MILNPILISLLTPKKWKHARAYYNVILTEASNFPHSILLLSQKSNDYLFAMWVFQQSLLKAFSGFHQVSKQMFNQAQRIKPKALQVSSIIQLSSNSGKASSYLWMLSNNHFFTNLWKKRFTSNYTMSTDRSSVKLNCSFRYNSYSSRLHFVFNLFQRNNVNTNQMTFPNKHYAHRNWTVQKIHWNRSPFLHQMTLMEYYNMKKS